MSDRACVSATESFESARAEPGRAGLDPIKNSNAKSDAAVFYYSGSQTRTDDNLINSQVLYQLSYAGMT